MNGHPILDSDLPQIAAIGNALTGNSIDSVWYRQTGSGGLGGVPDDAYHEVDLDVVLVGAYGAVSFTWERDDDIEGISVDFHASMELHQGVINVRVGESPQWLPFSGMKVRDVVPAWQQCSPEGPLSLFSVRIEMADGNSFVISLGEFEDGSVRYFPDSLIVIFDEQMARSYRPNGVVGSAWGS